MPNLQIMDECISIVLLIWMDINGNFYTWIQTLFHRDNDDIGGIEIEGIKKKSFI